MTTTTTTPKVQILTGQTAQRGNAWTGRTISDGQPNHYPGAIPAADVANRLFDWEALSVPVSITLPATFEDMTSLDAEGNPVKVLTVPDRQAIVNSKTLETYGIFKSGFKIHQYRQYLLAEVSAILGDTLQISSAGLAAHGARGWVEVSVPDTITTPEGVEFRPNLLAATSLDGSLATTYRRTITNILCDNQMAALLGNSADAMGLKIRHTRNSEVKVQDARHALALVHATAEGFEAEVRKLVRTTVTQAQWSKFVTTLAPIPEEAGRARTIATNKVEALTGLWNGDHRVAPWKNTAWGVVQAVNTYTHHVENVRGATRDSRNMDKAIKGEYDKLDRDTLGLLGKVLANA